MALSSSVLVSTSILAFSVETRFQKRGGAMHKQEVEAAGEGANFADFAHLECGIHVRSYVRCHCTVGLRFPDRPPDRDFTGFCRITRTGTWKLRKPGLVQQLQDVTLSLSTFL